MLEAYESNNQSFDTRHPLDIALDHVSKAVHALSNWHDAEHKAIAYQLSKDALKIQKLQAKRSKMWIAQRAAELKSMKGEAFVSHSQFHPKGQNANALAKSANVTLP